jgi:hypothetical protein
MIFSKTEANCHWNVPVVTRLPVTWDIVPRAYVPEWYKKCLNRREEVEDDQQPGCPVALKTD